jgi:hypothetical protein
MDGDLVSIGVGVVALAGVGLQYRLWRKDYEERRRQLTLVARQVRALENFVQAQDRVITELAAAQQQRSAIWEQQVKRRQQKDSFEKSLTFWDLLRDVLDL